MAGMYGKNQVSRFEKTGTRLNLSMHHSCAQCGRSAAEDNPLIQWKAVVDMGKRREQLVDAIFYAHRDCVMAKEIC
jgi:hypothetical protein